MPTQRIDFVDALRALAAIAIVFLHVSSPIAQAPVANPGAWWWCADLVYSLARPSIALFIMISGFLLLSPSKEEGLGAFFRKRFIRIAVPFLAWGLVYFVWKNHAHVSASDCARLAREFVEGPVYYHLWFIYTITGIYLATPVLRVYVKNASIQNYSYLVATWFAGTCLYPIVGHFWGIRIGIPIMTAGGFLGAFLLGDFLRKFAVDKSSRIWLALVAATCCAVTVGAGYALSGGVPAKYDAVFQEFLSPTVVVTAACIFLMCKDLSFAKMRARFPGVYSVMSAVSGTSFSVYLMHIMVLEVLKSHIPGFSLDATFIHPAIGIPLTAGVTIFFCVVATLALRKIPFVKYCLP
jgi:surface polysaccharide O-acyltransferase-like enzyme